METIIFLLLAAVTLGSAGMVVLEKNPVYSVLFLVVTLCSLAVVYATLGAPFLAAIQVIVYAGAIMVLFLFVVMLLDLRRGRGEGQFPYQSALAPAMVVLLLLAVALALSTGHPAQAPGPDMAAAARPGGNVAELGRLLFGEWLYPLEVAGVLLLAAVIGAVVLSKR
jgi:NADH-quinone oxidoreductase subunit J